MVSKNINATDWNGNIWRQFNSDFIMPTQADSERLWCHFFILALKIIVRSLNGGDLKYTKMKYDVYILDTKFNIIVILHVAVQDEPSRAQKLTDSWLTLQNSPRQQKMDGRTSVCENIIENRFRCCF